MTRKIFLVVTMLFWLAVLGIWYGCRLCPTAVDGQPIVATSLFKLKDVAAHTKQDDCWMAINGNVYDLSAYIPEHPSRPDVILPWCGQEATEAYRTKTKGREHSPAADQLLKTYQIGLLHGEN